MDNAFIQIVGSVGFPIAVAAFCLVKLQSSLDANTKSNQAIANLLQQVCDKLNIQTPKT